MISGIGTDRATVNVPPATVTSCGSAPACSGVTTTYAPPSGAGTAASAREK
jgi:hypothetical protein